MSLGSLLVSRDKEMIRVLRPALENLSIEVEVSRGARSGTEILSSEKFDAVIIDCDDLYGGLDVLQSLRRSPSNKNSVSFAILNGKTTTHQAFELGAQFVMQKPISQLGATRCVGAALGFMERERRRYFRYPVEMPVVVAFGRQELKLTAMNLSDGGLALRLRGKLPKSGITRVSFTPPGAHACVDAKAEIAWIDGTSSAGIRFVELSLASRQKLGRWLAEQPQ